MDFEFKAIDSTVELVEKSDTERSIVHYISTVDYDRQGDIVHPKGMNDKDYSSNPVVLFNHDSNRPIAKSLWRKPEDKGVLAKTQFSKKSLFADDIYNLHLEGILNTWSIGLRPATENGKVVKGALEYDNETNTLNIFKWDLLEYSSAPIPANPNAIDQIKSMVKSMEAQNILKDIESEVEIKNILSSYKSEIKQLQDMINELKEFNLEHTNLINVLNKDIGHITEIITKKAQKQAAETLGEPLAKRLEKKLAGEVSRKLKL